MNFSTCTYIVPTNRRDRIYAVQRFIAPSLANSCEGRAEQTHFPHRRDHIMEFNKISAVFSVGTAFMPSSDSSQHIKMNPGSKRVQIIHGDESPDAINRVPTGMNIGQRGRMIGRRERND
jgi:hypothetical protein